MNAETGIPSEQRCAAYRKFEVERSSCNFSINDQVTPATIIGKHPVTGQEIRASLNGHIATIYFNPMHNSLMIMVVANFSDPQGHFAERRN